MNITILSCAWKRPEVFEMFARSIKELGVSNVVIVGSEGDRSRRMVESHGFMYFEHDNIPLGDKWNYGMQKCKELQPDYVLTLGSDDLITKKLFDLMKKEAAKGYDFIGLTDFYFYDLHTEKLILWKGYDNHRKGESCGAGRMLKRSLLDRLKWQPWSSTAKFNGLDGSMSKKLSGMDHSSKMISLVETSNFAVDIKTPENITSLSSFSCYLKVDKSLLINNFPYVKKQ